MTDWTVEITKMADAKKLVQECDAENLWRHESPRAPVDPERLNEAMRRVGHEFDEEYVSFLLHSDGWPAFFQDIDLFGTEEILGSQFDEAWELVETLEPETLTASKFDIGSVVLIGASRSGIDMFLMLKKRAEGTDPVIWVAGLEIERFDSFASFFRAMIDFNINEAEALRNRHNTQ